MRLYYMYLPFGVGSKYFSNLKAIHKIIGKPITYTNSSYQGRAKKHKKATIKLQIQIKFMIGFINSTTSSPFAHITFFAKMH